MPTEILLQGPCQFTLHIKITWFRLLYVNLLLFFFNPLIERLLAVLVCTTDPGLLADACSCNFIAAHFRYANISILESHFYMQTLFYRHWCQWALISVFSKLHGSQFSFWSFNLVARPKTAGYLDVPIFNTFSVEDLKRSTWIIPNWHPDTRKARAANSSSLLLCNTFIAHCSWKYPLCGRLQPGTCFSDFWMLFYLVQLGPGVKA